MALGGLSRLLTASARVFAGNVGGGNSGKALGAAVQKMGNAHGVEGPESNGNSTGTSSIGGGNATNNGIRAKMAAAIGGYTKKD